MGNVYIQSVFMEHQIYILRKNRTFAIFRNLNFAVKTETDARNLHDDCHNMTQNASHLITALLLFLS